MKSLIKYLSLSLLIAAPAFAAQQQAEQSTQVEHKLTQAQLDAFQFAKEQESKKLSAAINKEKQHEQNCKVNAGLKELLEGATIKGEPLDLHLLDKLPSAVQEQIAKSIYSHAFNHGYQLLPAIIPSCCTLHLRPGLEVLGGQGKIRYKRIFEAEGHLEDRLYVVNITHTESEKKGKNEVNMQQPGTYTHGWIPRKQLTPFNVSGKIVNDKLYLQKDSLERVMLENCSAEQITLIRALWQKNHRAIGGTFLHLDEEETQIFNSLPDQMRNNLETNYNLKTVKKCCTRTAFATAVAAVGTVAAWFLTK